MELTWWHVFFAFIAGVGLTCASLTAGYVRNSRRYVDTREMYDPETRS